MEFVKKVYVILSIITSATCLINTIIYSNWPFNGSRDYVKEHKNHLIPFTIFWLIAFILLICLKFSEKYPLNFVFLGIHTMSNSYLVAYLACKSDLDEILITLFLTIFIVASITAYSYKCTIFNIWHPAIFLLGSLTLIFGILLMVLGYNNSKVILLMIFLFTFYLLVDTGFMLSGKSKFLITILPRTEYAIAAVLKLYIDIIGIFVTGLALLSD